jgi:hypothetical protein
MTALFALRNTKKGKSLNEIKSSTCIYSTLSHAVLIKYTSKETH